MTAVMLEAPTDFRPFDLAEWVELFMVLNDLTSLSRSAFLQLFPAGQAPDGAEIDELFGEVRRRADIAPHLYPFRDVEESIVREPDIDGRIYRLLLMMSLEVAPFRQENRYNEINPAFELLTREAMISYMGQGALGRRFGWPSGDGRPQYLADAIEWLAQAMSLQVGDLADIDADDKDGGVDVVVWKPFADGSPAFSVYLIQCTVQAGYEGKAGGINAARWLTWIKFGQAPQKVLSIPHAVPLDAKVRVSLGFSFHVLLDRLRICEKLDGGTNLAHFAEYEHIAEWVTAEIEKTRLALTTPGARRPRPPKPRRPLNRGRPR